MPGSTESVEDSSATDYRKIDLEDLTTCQPKHKRARQQLIQQHSDTFLNSSHAQNHPDHIRHHYAPTPQRNVVVSPHLSLSQVADHSRSQLDAPLLGLNRRIDSATWDRLKTIFLLFSAVVLIALFFFGDELKYYARSESKSVIAVSAGSQSQESSINKGFFKPLFGPVAVQQCQHLCQTQESSEQAACNSSCRALSSAEFGKRASVDAHGPEADVQVVISRCSPKSWSNGAYNSDEEWRREIEQALALLDAAPTGIHESSLAQGRLFASSISSTLNSLRAPASNDAVRQQFTRNLVETCCLRAHAATAELALVEAQQNSDEVGRGYYSLLQRRLKDIALDKENNLFIVATNLQLKTN